MKVALVLERFDWRKGGLESWTWQFAQVLKNEGIEVHVVAFEFHPAAQDEGVVIHHLEKMPRSRLDRAAALEQHLRALKPDVIHDMGVGWHADVFHPHGGSTLATWKHNLLRIPRWRRFKFWRARRHREIMEIERRQHANSGAVTVAVSNMVKQHLQSLHNLPEHKVRVIYNGVDLHKFSPDHRAFHRKTVRDRLGIGNKVLFFLLAHNLRLKNASTLIRSMGLLAAGNKPVHLVIAGGDSTAPYVRLAARTGAARQITFLGLVEPVEYYAAADVCVLPTWYDPCSLFTLEAWAAGLPVITTRYNGASELMTGDRQGFALDDPEDHIALAAKMETLLEPHVRARMSQAARELALNHSFQKQAEQFIELYHDVKNAKQ